jgi:hypothetical protein
VRFVVAAEPNGVLVLERIPRMNRDQLAVLEANAKRILEEGPSIRHPEARAVLDAISLERDRRDEDERERQNAARGAIADRLKNEPLFRRVIAAFSEMPPQDWEAEVLNAVAAHPGRDGDFLARSIGKQRFGYINFAMGTLCSTREAYLGGPPPSERRPGEVVHSGLLMNFSDLEGPDGSRRTGWTLKPEAEAALRHLGVVGRPGSARSAGPGGTDRSDQCSTAAFSAG